MQSVTQDLLKAAQRSAVGVFLMTLSMLVASNQAVASYFEIGERAVEQVEISKASGAPVEFRAIYPSDAADETLVPIFLFHGFLVQNQFYDAIAKHLASHGYAVFSPQMYARSPLPFGKPSLDKEAEIAYSLLNWSTTSMAAVLPLQLDFDKSVLIGHSRGAHVAWNMLKQYAVPASVVIGLDPVDGDNRDAITTEPLPTLPSLTFGLKKSGSCAPDGRNYENFYAQSSLGQSHWLITADNYGHMDFLTGSCGLPCNFCGSGLGGNQSRAQLTSIMAGASLAFLQQELANQTNAARLVEEYLDLFEGFTLKMR